MGTVRIALTPVVFQTTVQTTRRCTLINVTLLYAFSNSTRSKWPNHYVSLLYQLSYVLTYLERTAGLKPATNGLKCKNEHCCMDLSNYFLFFHLLQTFGIYSGIFALKTIIKLFLVCLYPNFFITPSNSFFLKFFKHSVYHFFLLFFFFLLFLFFKLLPKNSFLFEQIFSFLFFYFSIT